MKKIIMMLAMLAIAFAVQAQTKFHDVEAYEAKGAVKSIKSEAMGREITVNFTQDGKQQDIIDAKYDADGYLQSSKQEVQGTEVTMSYKWENGRVAVQTMNAMGNEITVTFKYNDKGEVVSQSMPMMSESMAFTYSDYKYDEKGNWISRKASVMGQTMEMTRTIEYYK